MKVIIINGSPKKEGSIAKLLEAIANELRKNNSEVTFVNISDLNIGPCQGCMSCRLSKQCSQYNDDAQKILELIKQSDNIVLGSPCYWGNITGQLKILFDRMVYGMMTHSPKGMPQPLMQGKKAIILATSSTRAPWNRIFHQTSGVTRALREIFRWSGIKIAGSMQRGDTRNHTIDKKDLIKARKLAHKIL